jgi:hypothetical protein
LATPEANFWQLIKKHLPGDVSRVENTADTGTPDVTGAWEGLDYWIELKVSGLKKKVEDPANLCREAQLVWHLRRGRQGSLVFVLVRYPRAIRLYIFTERYAQYVCRNIFLQTNGFDWPQFTLAIKSEIRRHRERLRTRWST